MYVLHPRCVSRLLVSSVAFYFIVSVWYQMLPDKNQGFFNMTAVCFTLGTLASLTSSPAGYLGTLIVI